MFIARPTAERATGMNDFKQLDFAGSDQPFVEREG
jgi:hypothetical protein